MICGRLCGLSTPSSSSLCEGPDPVMGYTKIEGRAGCCECEAVTYWSSARRQRVAGRNRLSRNELRPQCSYDVNATDTRKVTGERSRTELIDVTRRRQWLEPSTSGAGSSLFVLHINVILLHGLSLRLRRSRQPFPYCASCRSSSSHGPLKSYMALQ